jgi:hypothetical protein
MDDGVEVCDSILVEVEEDDGNNREEDEVASFCFLNVVFI